jgi:two-component system, OmpR family, phosphate regulon sensor histidine kinase PhoR
MRRFGAPASLILAFVFPAMIAAALALAYYGFKYADSFSGPIEAMFQDMARDEWETLSRDLDARVDEAATGLLQRIATRRAELAAAPAAADPEDPPLEPPSSCDVDRGPVIDAFVVFGPGRTIECYGPRSARTESQRAIRRDWEALAKRLAWNTVKAGPFNHFHDVDGDQSRLITYSARMGDTQPYHVAARLNLDLITREWLEQGLKAMRKNMRVVVKDDLGRVVAGDPASTPEGRFTFTRDIFSRALYKWRVHITTQNAQVFEEQMQRQEVLEPLLIILSTSIIAVGLGIVWLSVIAERRASRMKSDFIANVSHELKTPLSLIRMFGEMVATGRHKGEQAVQEYGSIITRESERLSHLIDNVLDFARLERGKASYHFNEGDLAEVLERALDVCRYRLEKEKVKLRTSIAPDLPPVRMDDNALTLVILNLVDNAIKYAAEGVYVDVTLGRRPGGVVLAVRDHGQGISPEEQDRIFERFYRARNARDRNVRGSGIGLALVKHIAEAHGGRVEVESPVRDAADRAPGCVFRVYLPAPVSDTAGPELIDAGKARVAG